MITFPYFYVLVTKVYTNLVKKMYLLYTFFKNPLYYKFYSELIMNEKLSL